MERLRIAEAHRAALDATALTEFRRLSPGRQRYVLWKIRQLRLERADQVYDAPFEVVACVTEG